jgi:hypothetical protein
MIPNIHSIAMNYLPKQLVKIKLFDEFTTDNRGNDVPSYAEPYDAYVNIQPVAKRDYIQMGLDQNKQYFTVHLKGELKSVSADKAPDIILFNDWTLEVVEVELWNFVNGWSRLICIAI